MSGSRLRVLWIFTILLSTSDLAKASNQEERYSIVIGDAVHFLVQNRPYLNERCRTDKEIFGCTIFSEEHLTCFCERDRDRWLMQARARFVPIIVRYVSRPFVVDHEQLHIDDVREMLAGYLERITGREFTTQEDCLREAGAVSNDRTFRLQMNEFRRKSNQRLH